MTLRDLQEHAEGVRWREKRLWEREAWLASVLLHAWIRNAPSPKELLGERVVDAEASLEAVVGGGAQASLDMLDKAYEKQARMKNGRS